MTLPRQLRLRLCFALAIFLPVVAWAPRHPIPVLAPLDLWTAEVVEGLVRATGMEVRRSEAVLVHPDGFACEIYYRCTGLLPAGVLAAAILVSPAPRRYRWTGVALATAFVLGLNFLRLVSLFHVGVRRPAAFDVAHAVIGESVIVASLAAFWLAWWRRRPRAIATVPQRDKLCSP